MNRHTKVRKRCFELFEKHISSRRMLIDVVIGARVTVDTAKHLYKEWLKFSMKRGKKTLLEERKARETLMKKRGSAPILEG